VVVKGDFKHEFDIDACAIPGTRIVPARPQPEQTACTQALPNYKKQPLEVKFNERFEGTLASYGLNADAGRMPPTHQPTNPPTTQSCHHP
jgi:phosphoribosylformylglycinamidine synthase